MHHSEQCMRGFAGSIAVKLHPVGSAMPVWVGHLLSDEPACETDRARKTLSPRVAIVRTRMSDSHRQSSHHLDLFIHELLVILIRAGQLE